MIMIDTVLGFVVFASSVLAYSALHSNSIDSRLFNLHKIGRYSLAYVLILILQGSTGIAIMKFGLNVKIHTFYTFLLFLSFSAYTMFSLLKSLYKKNGKFHLGKELVDCYVYVFVIFLTVAYVNSVVKIPESASILVVGLVSIVLLALCIILIKTSKELFTLVDCVNVVSSLRIICVAFALYGLYAIVRNFTVYGCTLLLAAHIVFLLAGVSILREIYCKYYVPLRMYSRSVKMKISDS